MCSCVRSRWNHNPKRVEPLLQELLSKGYAVQLRHVPTETSFDNVSEHGYIALFDASGKELAKRMGFQHNRKLRSGGAWDNAAVEEVVAEAIKESKAQALPAAAAATVTPQITAGAGAPSA